MPTEMMQVVVVHRFGGPEELVVEQRPLDAPGPGRVRLRLTSIGMNHADLMARRGEYRLSSGDPPFVPGIEAGGVIDSLGPGVVGFRVGQRVILTPDAPRRSTGTGAEADYLGGTYRSHYYCGPEHLLAVPDQVPEPLTGALWLAYLTAWGCLVWKHQIKPGAIVGLPACSSSVAIAAAQIAREAGAVPIGLTTSKAKVDLIRKLLPGLYEEVVVTHDAGRMLPWHQEIKKLTAGHGVDLYFDPVGAGDYLNTQVRSLAQSGTIWVYGLLGKPGVVDVQPLIRKHGAIRGWLLGELVSAGREHWLAGCNAIFKGFETGRFTMPLGGEYRLMDVRKAHEEFEKAGHVGKPVLRP
jgi:NADPH:quinone reductase-like Zn-dependent oxidoreductase